MSMKTIKAIQMSQMEQELRDVLSKINMAMRIINSGDGQWTRSFKQRKEKEVVILMATKKELGDKITEYMLLESDNE